MKTIIILSIIALLCIVILVRVKPKIQKMNRSERKIFRDAMKDIDKSKK